MLKKILVKEIYLPIIYIIVGILIYIFLSRIIQLSLNRKQNTFNKNSYNYKKIQTFRGLIKNIIKIIISILVILSILPVYGINVSSILAGLGIASAAIALALQDLLKDVFSGISIIINNEFAIGDIVSIGDFKGEVISIGIKTTRIRNYEGQIKIIANRNISEIINYSCSYSLAIVDIDISYEEDSNKVEKVLTDIAKELSQKLTKLKGNIELLGIESLEPSSVVYRMVVKTESMEHIRIEREIRKFIKIRLEEEGIKIPYPQIEVHNGK